MFSNAYLWCKWCLICCSQNLLLCVPNPPCCSKACVKYFKRKIKCHCFDFYPLPWRKPEKNNFVAITRIHIASDRFMRDPLRSRYVIFTNEISTTLYIERLWLIFLFVLLTYVLPVLLPTARILIEFLHERYSRIWIHKNYGILQYFLLKSLD